MAGIGFRLQKLLQKNTYTSLIRAYLFSSVIATGPMLITILTLSAVRLLVVNKLSSDEGVLFQSLVVYSFAFSLIGTGPFLYIATRFIADRHYVNDVDAFTPTYISMLTLVLPLQLCVAILFLMQQNFSFLLSATLLVLYLSVNGIWIAMVFISAARNYFSIVLAYMVGGGISIIASSFFGNKMGMTGFLIGYTSGQVFCFTVLSVQIFFEFGYKQSFDYNFIEYFRKYPSLAFIGTAYNLAIWIDKFLFWNSSHGEKVAPWLYICRNYDTPQFIAFMSVVPSMAFFIIQLETSFAQKFHHYFATIGNKGTLAEIRSAKAKLIDNLVSNYQTFIFVQGVVSTIFILGIYRIVETFHFNPAQIGIMRISILGAFLEVVFIIILNMFFYFDFRKEAALITTLYLVVNGFGTLVSLKIGVMAHGYGYALAGFITGLWGLMRLIKKLDNLNYWTFMRQPIYRPMLRLTVEKEEKSL